jgi:hypothetical protein
MLHPWLTISFVFVFSPTYTTAYTWQFTSPPRQCQNLSIAVQGSGQPPYSLLLIPNGPSPLPNNTEVRTIQNIPFSGSSTSLSFELNYPENSSFVAVVCLYLVLIPLLESFAYNLPHYPQVSDSSGFGTGGTSTPITVLQSSDSSCYNPTQGIQLPFFFYIDPTGGITQCESVRLWWYQNLVNGYVLHFPTLSLKLSLPLLLSFTRHIELSISMASSRGEFLRHLPRFFVYE